MLEKKCLCLFLRNNTDLEVFEKDYSLQSGKTHKSWNRNGTVTPNILLHIRSLDIQDKIASSGHSFCLIPQKYRKSLEAKIKDAFVQLNLFDYWLNKYLKITRGCFITTMNIRSTGLCCTILVKKSSVRCKSLASHPTSFSPKCWVVPFSLQP